MNQPAIIKSVPAARKDGETRLVEILGRLKSQHRACSLKLSTEDAAMSPRQIAYWTRLAGGIFPVIVKIGGPNARNDMRTLLDLGVDGLIAPMVESAYGLENFLEALREYAPTTRFPRLRKQINIETITAVEHLDAILDCPGSAELDEITIGCTDLSRSMKKPASHPAVLDLVHRVVEKIRRRNLPVSLGGGIHPGTIDALLDRLRPAEFNTRVVTFAVHPDHRYGDAVREALEFEVLMLENDAALGFISPADKRSRIEELRQRLNPGA